MHYVNGYVIYLMAMMYAHWNPHVINFWVFSTKLKNKPSFSQNITTANSKLKLGLKWLIWRKHEN